MKKDCWAAGGGASQQKGGKGKGSGGSPKKKDANSWEENKEDAQKGEASGLELCALGDFAQREKEKRSRSISTKKSLRSEDQDDPRWLKCNLDTGASVSAFPRKFRPDGQKFSGQFKTASGQMINNYGPVVVEGIDEKGVKRRVTGSATDVHKVLISAAKLYTTKATVRGLVREEVISFQTITR